jgi:hypothetical protein
MKWPVVIVVLLAGCSHGGVRVDTLFGLTLLTVAAFDYERDRMRYREDRFMPLGGARPDAAPPLATDRKISEQDCTRPIEDFSANLRCR